MWTTAFLGPYFSDPTALRVRIQTPSTAIIFVRFNIGIEQDNEFFRFNSKMALSSTRKSINLTYTSFYSSNIDNTS